MFRPSVPDVSNPKSAGVIIKSIIELIKMKNKHDLETSTDPQLELIHLLLDKVIYEWCQWVSHIWPHSYN